jgi:hypothetical protein
VDGVPVAFSTYEGAIRADVGAIDLDVEQHLGIDASRSAPAVL